MQNFNPRLREGGDLKRFVYKFTYYNFNPRLREGGDVKANVDKKLIAISIHASAKEATFLLAIFSSVLIISIHASAKEATRMALFYFLSLLFQSTPPRRRRQINRPLEILIPYFNPRLREGGDRNIL